MPNGRTKKSRARRTGGGNDDDLKAVQKSHPKHKVTRVKNTTNKYTLRDSNGHTVTLTRTKTKNPVKKHSVKEAIKRKG